MKDYGISVERTDAGLEDGGEDAAARRAVEEVDVPTAAALLLGAVGVGVGVGVRAVSGAVPVPGHVGGAVHGEDVTWRWWTNVPSGDESWEVERV